MFSDFLRIFIVRFDLIFQADQIIINDTEQKVWSIEDDGQSSDQEREILVLKKEKKNMVKSLFCYFLRLLFRILKTEG